MRLGENSRSDEAFNALRELLGDPVELGKWRRKRGSPKRDTLLRQGDLLIVAPQQLSVKALRSFPDTKGLKVGEALLADVLHPAGRAESKRSKR
jgi:hypothetical protein